MGMVGKYKKLGNKVVEQTWTGMPCGETWEEIPGAISLIETTVGRLAVREDGLVYCQPAGIIPAWMPAEDAAFYGSPQDASRELLAVRTSEVRAAVSAAINGMGC